MRASFQSKSHLDQETLSWSQGFPSPHAGLCGAILVFFALLTPLTGLCNSASSPEPGFYNSNSVIITALITSGGIGPGIQQGVSFHAKGGLGGLGLFVSGTYTSTNGIAYNMQGRFGSYTDLESTVRGTASAGGQVYDNRTQSWYHTNGYVYITDNDPVANLSGQVVPIEATKRLRYWKVGLQPLPEPDDVGADGQDDPNAPNTLDRGANAEAGGKINLAFGSEQWTKMLLSVQGVREVSFALSYNSRFINRSSGELAAGWSVLGSLFVTDDGIGSVRVNLPSSGIIRFIELGGGYTCLTPSVRNVDLSKIPDGGWMLKYGDGRSFTFNAQGRLLSDSNSAGAAISYAYQNDKVSEIRDEATGRWIRYEYNSAGKLARVFDQVGREATFIYEGEILSSIVDARGKRTSFSYDASGRMTQLRGNDNAVLTANTYDAEGRVVSQTDARGNTFTIDYAPTPTGGSFVTLIDRTGASSFYEFEAGGRFLSYEDPLGNKWTNEYDMLGQLEMVTLPSGRTRTVSFDAEGNLVSASGPNGGYASYGLGTGLPSYIFAPDFGSTTIQRNEALQPISIVDPVGNESSFAYNSLGQLVSATKTGGYSSAVAYTNGLPAQVTEATGLTTQFAYDAVGRLTSLTSPGNRMASRTLDAGGYQTSISMPGNRTVSAEYDDRGRPIKTTFHDGTSITRVFDGNHNLTSETDQLGRTTTYVYDEEDRLTTITEPGNRTTSISRDAAGRVTQVRSPGGKIVSYAHDDDGNVLSVTAPDGTQTKNEYDDDGLVSASVDQANRRSSIFRAGTGNVSMVISPEQRIRNFYYDTAQRLTRVSMPSGKEVSVSHDDSDRKVEVTDLGGRKTVHEFDTSGRPAAVVTPAGRRTSYQYGSDGLLSAVVHPSGKTNSMARNPAGEIVSLTDPSGTTSITRDSMGRVTAVAKGGKTVLRTYDSLGRLLSYTDSEGRAVGYSYDTAGNLSSITYPDGTSVTYQYDADGLMTRVTDWAGRVTQITRDSAGRPLAVALPNGTTNSYSYAATGRVAGIVATGATNIFSRAISYSPDGLIMSESGASAPATPPPDLVMSYDSDNRLTTCNGVAVNYDADGNMLSIPTRTSPMAATYDAAGRLASAGGVASGYDPEGRRAKVTDASGESMLVYDTLPDLDRVIFRLNPVGTTTKYVYGPGLLYEVTGSTVRYYHADSRGSTVALTDASGAVTDTFAYGPFGEIFHRTGSTSTPFQFCGQHGVQTDSNGLIYKRARFYSPEIKRFISQDTYLGSPSQPLSLNRYAYAEGNPISLIDPTGFAAVDAPDGPDDPFSKLPWWQRQLAYDKYILTEFNINLATGWGDTLDPFGVAQSVRKAMGWNDVVDQYSLSYRVGEGLGFGTSLALGKIPTKPSMVNITNPFDRLASRTVGETKLIGGIPTTAWKTRPAKVHTVDIDPLISFGMGIYSPYQSLQRSFKSIGDFIYRDRDVISIRP